MHRGQDGAIAQLGERLHGMQEVGGSIPPGSTKSFQKAAPSGGFFVGGTFSSALCLMERALIFIFSLPALS